MIEQAIATTNSQQQRQRKLPSGLMISLVIAMSLWSSVSMRTVLKNLVNGLSQKWIQVAEYGNRTGTTAVDFRYGYTGRELDGETGLYYYRARYYDPSVGRFISEDPAGFGAGDPNLYRYVGNNSTNATDPSGMWELPSWNDITQPFQVAGQFWGGVGTNIYNGLTDNGFTQAAQRNTEYFANIAVRGEREGNWGDIALGWGLGLVNSAFTKDNIVNTTAVLAAPLLLPVALEWAAATTVGRIALAIPGVVPVARILLGMEGVKHGSQQVGQAWYGVGEDGRQLSTPERLVTGFNGLLAVGTSAFDLSGSIRTILPTKGSAIAQIGEYDGRMSIVPKDKSGNRLTEYGTKLCPDRV